MEGAIYFDLDGTLIDSSRCAILSTQQAFHEILGIAVPETDILHYMGVPIEQSFGIFADDQDMDISHLVTRFREIYNMHTDEMCNPYQGVEALLCELGQRFHLSVVTSKRKSVAQRNLQACNLMGFIEQVIGSDDVAEFKPNPAPVYKAREGLPKEIESEIVVGDTTFDIEMGKKAGALCIGVLWGSHSEEELSSSGADFLAEYPEEILSFLD